MIYKETVASRPGSFADVARRGFTLIELLVVILIILIISAVALPTVLPALAHRQVSEAARILQGGLVGARDSAIHNNAPSGIRLLPDPAFPVQTVTNTSSPYYGQIDPTTILAANRFVPLEPAPEYTSGRVSAYSPAIYTLPSTWTTAYAGLSVLVLEQAPYPTSGTTTIPNEPTSWFWNIRRGDKVQIGNAGQVYTVVGPMDIGPAQGNSEQFVNATTYPSRLTTNGHLTISWDYLYLVNGQDDNKDGFIDNGWDPASFNPAASPEIESWIGSLVIPANPDNPIISSSPYSITRRPVPSSKGREVALPSNVVVDLTTWNSSALGSLMSNAGYQSERSRLPVNPYTGYVDIMINPDGTVLPTTVYSSPTSFGMSSAFFHFWLAERDDLAAPAVSNGVPTPLISGQPFLLPITPPNGSDASRYTVTSLKGENRLVTLFTRTGQIVTDESVFFDDPFNPANTTTGYNISLPFQDAQQGLAGGP